MKFQSSNRMIRLSAVMFLISLTIGVTPLIAQTKPSSEQIATGIMESKSQASSFVLEGVSAIWKRTGRGVYFNYMQRQLDALMKSNALSVDYGLSFFELYQVTGQEKYLKAAITCFQESQNTPRVLKTEALAIALNQDDRSIATAIQNLQNRYKLLKRSTPEMVHYGYTLTGALDYMPASHPKIGLIKELLNKWAVDIEKDALSDLQIYTLARGVSKGYLPNSFLQLARKAYQKSNAKDAALLTIVEMETAELPKPGLRHQVLLDSYFNNEIKKDKNGGQLSWHYKWEEQSNGGFSVWAGLFQEAGFQTKTLYAAPTKSNLQESSIYIIVDPDIKKENENAKFIDNDHISHIRDWVSNGGVLVLMANDTGNVELDHFNELATIFGIKFKKESKGRVIGNQFEMAKLMVPAKNEVFKTAKQLYIKEYSSLALSNPAKSVIQDAQGDHVISTAKYGKGAVFAIGDPWLYNEYVDGRKLPPDYDNFAAARDLVYWLAAQIK